MSVYLWRSSVALLLMLLAATYYQYCESKKRQSISQTRAVRVQLQEAEQQQSVLEQYHKHPLLNVLGEDFSALQIRMAEHLNRAHRPPQETGRSSVRYSRTREQQDAGVGQGAQASTTVKDYSLAGPVTSYRQSALPDVLQLAADADIVNAAVFKFRTLRIDVQIQVSNAPEMLAFLRRLKTASGGWPGDIRACDIHRSPRPGIDARCVIDVYHWTVRTEGRDNNA